MCTIVNVTQSNYGKRPIDEQDTAFMELGPFLNNLPYNLLNQTWFNPDYTNWLNKNPNIVYEFAASLVYTLPGKRQEFYSNPSF
jgi:hypothetical protein